MSFVVSAVHIGLHIGIDAGCSLLDMLLSGFSDLGERGGEGQERWKEVGGVEGWRRKRGEEVRGGEGGGRGEGRRRRRGEEKEED